MNWHEICESPLLSHIPFKIETNQWGQVIMSPAKSRHAVLQSEILLLLNQHCAEPGRTLVECPIQTTQGVRVADVAWISQNRYQQVKEQDVYLVAPEICVEVISASNTKEEMLQKKALYFAAGAREFWLCLESGELFFYSLAGELDASQLAIAMPKAITID